VQATLAGFPYLAEQLKGVGMGKYLRDAAQQGCCARAYMDVFTAILQILPHARAV